jgi:hypothetical protein
MDLKKTAKEDVDWFHLTQYKDQWRALVDKVMNLWVSKGGNFLTS